MLLCRWTRITQVGVFLVVFFVLLAASTKNKNHKKEVKIRNKREGAWTKWSTWSPCTRKCGGGIRTQTRDCQLRRSRLKSKDFDDGKIWKNVSSRYCEGHSTRHHLCNTDICPKGSLKFRDSQCKTFDNRPFMGKVYQWESFMDERSPCSLTCRAIGFRFFATLNKSLIDGTSCVTNQTSELSVCIQGTCMPIGCDGIAGSQRRVDRCGVCGGDNSTCRVVSGIFTRPQLPVGYNMVAHLPKGACNLNITQIRKSPNFLALRRNDGSFVLNGNWAISWPGEYEAAGAKFQYTRQDLKSLESIVASGPLHEPIDLLVLYQQPNPGIKYEYMIPMSEESSGSVHSVADPFPSVSHQGHRQGSPRSLIPPPFNIGSPNNLVGNSNPNPVNTIPSFPSGNSGTSGAVGGAGGLFPSDSANVFNIQSSERGGLQGTSAVPGNPLLAHQGRRRHSHHNNKLNGSSEKKFHWKITSYTNCTEPCGGGTQRAIVRCIRASNGTPAPDRRCSGDQKPLGQTIRCNLKPCPAEWISGPWSSCSEGCGEGHQTRTVHCQQRVSPSLTMRVAEGACLGVQPDSRMSCSIKPCHRWEVTPWSQCSARCGSGIRSRTLECLTSEGDQIESSECDQGEKPLEISPCNMGPCHGFEWLTSEWSSECSQPCGVGIQTRQVVCSGPGPKSEDEKKEDDEENYCDDHKKPSWERECMSEKTCADPTWFTGSWSECSSHCDPGLKTRQVLCVLYNRGKYKIIEETLCSKSTRPADRMDCEENENCTPRWFITEWTECSAICGGGFQKRTISCRDSNRTTSSFDCLDSERPLERRSCNDHKCTLNTLSLEDQISYNEGDNSTSAFSETPKPEFLSIHSGLNGNQSQSDQKSQSQNEEPEDWGCEDEYRNCALVVQARLCKFKYYRSVCCISCSDKREISS